MEAALGASEIEKAALVMVVLGVAESETAPLESRGQQAAFLWMWEQEAFPPMNERTGLFL